MQIALITGSGRKSGLGYETARQLGETGYHIILATRRPDRRLLPRRQTLAVVTRTAIGKIRVSSARPVGTGRRDARTVQ
ncbi:hypothetical protein JS531_08165 [Bifidobacterium sp. CP2]|uniref:hypothetical protein n=1 Tax=Bifidobacterium sp. CP2 TaxID=2809025 RepID=UPI001BDD7F36|nr:hypothetical protein [Bifidobacterium sp. CP2]MBT1181924.1 hypothetical protein [Bifidobacterium sp. CP2]